MNEKRWLWLILAVYAALGMAYSWVVPLGESPDEVDHFLYVRYLIEQREFPVMQPVAADNETMEANQLPLFYLLNAVITAPFPMTASADLPRNACFTFDPNDGGRAHFYLHKAAEHNPFAPDYMAFRVARLLSVALGAVTVWLAYRLGRRLAPADKRVGLLAAGILAFNPQFIFMMASVNNDVLTAVFGAALVYFSVTAAQTPSLRRFIGLGVLVGLGLLTKFALLAFWPLPLLAVLLNVGNGRIKQTLQNGTAVIGLPVLIAGWWYVRAFRLYGDPLAWEVHLQAKGSEVLRTAGLTLADLGEFVVIHFQSYWAWFGWLKIQPADWVYALLAMFVLLAVGGFLLVLREGYTQRGAAKVANLLGFIRERAVITAVLFNILATAAIYASLLRYIQTINWSGYQGRLAYAAAAPMAALLALGWWRLTRFWRQKAFGSLPVVGLLLLAVASLVQLGGAFARPALYMPPVHWDRVCQMTSARFFVEAVDFPPTVAPGDSVRVSLGGYGRDGGTATGEIALLDWEGGLLDTAVLNLSWPAAAPISDTVQLTVPPDVLPMRARLAYFFNDDTVALGYLKVAAGETAVPQPTSTVSANFGDQIMLIGYDLQTEADSIRLTTYWQALRPIVEDFTIFVHLLDEAGNLIAQQDAQPQGGRYPTSIWHVGEVVVDERLIKSDAAETAVSLSVGLYMPENGQRVPLTAEGQPPGDALRLPLLYESEP
ncbi:MAG: hypothetical protein CL608_04950 [Anaerolineaceae bacterium]|nr:hypothetical protein [Anaerolineaceae bacterium]